MVKIIKNNPLKKSPKAEIPGKAIPKKNDKDSKPPIKTIPQKPSAQKPVKRPAQKDKVTKKANPPRKVKTGSPSSQLASKYVSDTFFEKLSIFKRLSARKVLSLDIDPDNIRFVMGLKSGTDFKVLSWGVQKFPTDEKDRKKALQIALENIKSKVYKRGMQVSVGIFSPEITIRQVTLPKMQKESDLRQAIDYKNKSDLQNYNEQSIWSYDILNKFEKEGTDYYTVLVTSAPYEIVNFYTQIFDKLKIELKKIYPRPASIQAAYRKMVFRPGRDLVINVAYDLTQMCFLKNGNLEFIRNVSIGSRNLEVTIHSPEQENETKKQKADKTDLSKSVENAALLRSKLLSKIKDLKNKQNPVLHTFFSEILRSLAFIQGRDVKQYIERIFVTGYGVRKESLMPYLRSRLNMPVFILTPQFQDNPVRTLEYGGYFTTLGNSLQESKSFNILPKIYQTRQIIKKVNILLIIIILAFTISLGYFSMEQTRVIKQKESLITQYNLEYEALNPFEGMYKDVKQQISEVSKRNSELHDYVKIRPPIIKVFRFFSNETPGNIRLEKLKFIKLINEEKKKKSSDKIFTNEYEYQVDLSGIIRTDPLMGDVTLINYVNKLLGLKFFKRVELLNKLKDSEKKITKFDIRMYL